MGVVTSLFENGKYLRRDIVGCTFYDQGDPVKLEPGQFVTNREISRLNIPSHYFVHPDSLRIQGAFEFAKKKKGKFSVGIIRYRQGRGDVILATVLAKALKSKYGNDVSVWYLVLPEHKELLLHNPYIDRIFTEKSSFKAAKPDIEFSTNDLDFKVERKEFEKNDKVLRNRTSIYLENIGLSLQDKTPVYTVTSNERRWAKKELSKLGYSLEEPIVGVQIYSASPSRTYPKMKQVVKKLKETYQVLVLDEKEEDSWKYTIRESVALLEQMDVLVSSNSFFFHIMGALRKKGVVLFGSVDGRIWTQDYEKIVPVEIPCPDGGEKCWWNLRCLPGDSYEEKQASGTPKCLSNIEVDQVVEEVQKRLSVKKVLVVVLTYNLLDLTKKAISSIRSSYDYDILVIDNDSIDGTQDWLRKRGIECISYKCTIPEAWNRGMKEAYERGYDYCMLCNNDIVLADNYIDTVIETAERRQAYAVTGNVISKGHLTKARTFDFSHFFIDVESYVTIQKAGDYSALLLSRECIEKIGRFDERFGPRYQADEDHLLRLRLAGRAPVKTYNTCFLHLLGQVVEFDAEAKKNHQKDWDRNVRLFRKLWGIDPYTERGKLKTLDVVKRRNKGWKDRIRLPIDGKPYKLYTENSIPTLVEVFKETIKKKKKVSVCILRRMGGYGDILFITVIARALKGRFGSSIILSYSVPEQFVPLLQGNRFIDNIVPEKNVERVGYDHIIDVTDYAYRKELREIEELGEVKSCRTKLYLDMLGIEKGTLKPDYFVDPQEIKWAEERWKFADGRKKLVIVWRGSNLMKVWPYMGTLVNKLRQSTDYAITILGNPENNNFKYTFREAAAIVSQADLVVSPDTGLSNLAGSLNVPVLTIFGNRNGKVFAKMFDTMIPIQGSCPRVDRVF